MNLKQINEKLAVWGTKQFSSMGAFWLFFCWGLLGLMPFFPDSFKLFVQLVSSAWIQLWALPLIAVGAGVLNAASEQRAQQDHQMIKQQFEEMKQIHEAIRSDLAISAEMVSLLREEIRQDRQIELRLADLEDELTD